jgi:glycerol-3-phosphate dehydrogenase
LRAALLLYDRLASRNDLPASATVDLSHHPIGVALQRPFGEAFAYSDCIVDDSRLVILNAVDAADRGAAIRTGMRCVRADRTDSWRLVAIDRGERMVISARALVNATGAWAGLVAENVLRLPAAAASHLAQAQPDRGAETVRQRQCLCVPEQRPAADFRQPL